MAILPSRNQKLLSGPNKDSISKMPDSILAQVLSLLPADEAVRTSVLSSKWRYIWGLASKIQFVMPRCNNRFEVQCFMDFVDRVMGLRNGMEIQEFRFHSSRKCDYDELYALICTVLKCELQVLDIHVSGPRREGINLPPYVFMNYKTLVALKVSECILLDVPAHVCFPSLKTLELKSVVYANEASVENLFSGCLVLEELLVERCLQRASDNIKKFNISLRSLKRLAILFGLDSHPCYFGLCKFKLEINTPNLEYLSITDHMSSDIAMSRTLSFLDEAYVDVQKNCRMMPGSLYNSCVRDLVRKISAVKSLSISGGTMRALGDPVHFDNLVYLSLGVDVENGWHKLPYYFEYMRNLEVLVFAEGLGGWLSSSKLRPPMFSPYGLRWKLKGIRIDGGFVGTKEELKLIKYLLEEAKVLSTVTISCFKADEKIRKTLLNFPKASPSCQLIIS